MLNSEHFQAVADAIKGFEAAKEVCNNLERAAGLGCYRADRLAIASLVVQLKRAATEAHERFDKFLASSRMTEVSEEVSRFQ